MKTEYEYADAVEEIEFDHPAWNVAKDALDKAEDAQRSIDLLFVMVVVQMVLILFLIIRG